MFLLQENRVRYNQQYYKDVFDDEMSVKLLDESISRPSLLQLIEVGRPIYLATSIAVFDRELFTLGPARIEVA